MIRHLIGARQQGTSLIEILMASAISLTLMAAVVNGLIHQRKVYGLREQVANMQQDARTAVDFLVRELRLAGFDPLTTSGAGILAASADQVQFSADLDADGATGGPDETVTYALYDADGDGDQDLGRDTGDGYSLMAENIGSLSFSYTLADATTTSTPPDLSQIRAITLNLTVQTAEPDASYPAHNGRRIVTLSTTVQLKNIGASIVTF